MAAAPARLHHAESDLTHLPAWYNERLTRVLWTNRSALAALNFTIGQPHTPGIDGVAGGAGQRGRRDAEAIVRLRTAAAACRRRRRPPSAGRVAFGRDGVALLGGPAEASHYLGSTSPANGQRGRPGSPGTRLCGGGQRRAGRTDLPRAGRRVGGGAGLPGAAAPATGGDAGTRPGDWSAACAGR